MPAETAPAPAAPTAPAAPSNATGSASIASAARSAGALNGGAVTTGTAGKGMQDAFAALGKKAGIEPKPEQKTVPEKPKVEVDDDDTALTNAEPKKDTTPDAPVVAAKTKKPSDFLREEKDKWKSKAEQYEKEIQTLKAPPADNPEVKTLNDRLDAESKTRKELEDAIRFANYERSPEYKEKWEKPFIDSYQSGRSKTSALKIAELKNEMGEVIRQSRPATAADFDAIMAAPTDEHAISMIEELFGTGARAQIVTLAREKVLERNEARESALKEFQKTGSEREKQMHETTAKVQKEVGSLWQDNIKSERVPDQWKPYILPKGLDGEGKPLDADGDAALERGYAFFDKATGEDARNPNLTPEQRKDIIARAASVRHRAAAFGRLTKWVKQRDTRIAELEKELEQYQKTEPGQGEGQAAAAGNGEAPQGTMASVLSTLQKRASTGKPVFH